MVARGSIRYRARAGRMLCAMGRADAHDFSNCGFGRLFLVAA